MDPLVITVTVDSSSSYPGNPLMPPLEDIETIADQYVRAVESGASIVHHHGIHRLEAEFGADGRKLSHIDVDGWAALTQRIQRDCDPIIQFGIASARLDEKISLFALQPDMMSYCFNVHDEYFQPDPAYPPVEIYALHPRDELQEFCGLARKSKIKPEIECFYTGAYWNLEFIRAQSLLEEPVWATIFIGWRGGAWTPATPDALDYMVRHLPAGVTWNVSVMDAQRQWPMLAQAIAMGGHVRVGWEDNPYLPSGELASQNADLVAVAVSLARAVGREVATPAQAREIIAI
jgi:3-keto-5-aminohexanoate cleavage enzyme